MIKNLSNKQLFRLYRILEGKLEITFQLWQKYNYDTKPEKTFRRRYRRLQYYHYRVQIELDRRHLSMSDSSLWMK